MASANRFINPEGQLLIKNIPLLQYQSEEGGLAITREGQLFDLNSLTLIQIYQVKQILVNVLNIGFDPGYTHLILKKDGQLLLIQCIHGEVLKSRKVDDKIEWMVAYQSSSGIELALLKNDGRWIGMETGMITMDFRMLRKSKNLFFRLIGLIFSSSSDNILYDLTTISNPHDIKSEDIKSIKDGVILTTDGIYRINDPEISGLSIIKLDNSDHVESNHQLIKFEDQLYVIDELGVCNIIKKSKLIQCKTPTELQR